MQAKVHKFVFQLPFLLLMRVRDLVDLSHPRADLINKFEVVLLCQILGNLYFSDHIIEMLLGSIAHVNDSVAKKLFPRSYELEAKVIEHVLLGDEVLLSM